MLNGQEIVLRCRKIGVVRSNEVAVVPPLQKRGLRVQQIHVRWTAGHEEEDYVLGLGSEVGPYRTGGSCSELVLQHTRQADRAQSAAKRLDKLPPGQWVINAWIHRFEYIERVSVPAHREAVDQRSRRG